MLVMLLAFVLGGSTGAGAMFQLLPYKATHAYKYLQISHCPQDRNLLKLASLRFPPIFPILARAIFNAQLTEAVAIRDAMAEIRDLDTILGQFSFDANGDAVYEATVLIVRNGQFEVFE